jgi:hypothetical protein
MRELNGVLVDCVVFVNRSFKTNVNPSLLRVQGLRL